MTMAIRSLLTDLSRCALALAAYGGAAAVFADEGGLEMFVGHWDVRVQILQPERQVLNYRETYERVLGGKFVRGHTEGKPDGTEDIVFGTYDAKVDGYPFWVFSSSGSYTYLPPGRYDARRRTMDWTNPSEWDVVYRSRCVYADGRTRRCELTIKDWKGKVLLEQEWTATRRNR
jgi:hypothetical protein